MVLNDKTDEWDRTDQAFVSALAGSVALKVLFAPTLVVFYHGARMRPAHFSEHGGFGKLVLVP